MAETKPDKQEAGEKKPVPTPKGRLVLATGTIVPVPAESVSVATHHYDPRTKATVPVVSSFIVSD